MPGPAARPAEHSPGTSSMCCEEPGLPGGVWFEAPRLLWGLAAGLVRARGILARIGAASVVGFGGYPCVAPVLASRLMRDRPECDVARTECGAGAGKSLSGVARRCAGSELRRDRARRWRGADGRDRQSGSPGDWRAGAVQLCAAGCRDQTAGAGRIARRAGYSAKSCRRH